MFALSIKYIETHENLVAVSAKVFVSATFKWPTKHIGDKHKYSLASHEITWKKKFQVESLSKTESFIFISFSFSFSLVSIHILTSKFQIPISK